jgi:hypothetical protein
MNPRFKNAACFLMFSALSEIMLDMYKYVKPLNHFDSLLMTKLFNLKVDFERVSKKAFLMFPEEEQLSFMNMINVFDKLIDSANDEKKFMQLMGLIEAWQNDQLTVVNTKEELVKVADDVKNNKIDVL